MTGPRLFVHGEAELAAATGLAEKNFRRERIRHFRQGEHWDIVDQHVAYTADGAHLVTEALLGRELTIDELTAALVGSRLTVPEKKEPPLVATVTKLWPNPWLLQVRLPSECLVNIRVRTSKNFRRGMTVPLRINPTNGQYELARRLPRFPGRW